MNAILKYAHEEKMNKSEMTYSTLNYECKNYSSFNTAIVKLSGFRLFSSISIKVLPY